MANDNIDPVGLTYAQASRLYYEISRDRSVREETIGAEHNLTTCMSAQVKPMSELHTYLKDNGWLHTGTVLQFHGTECSDDFKVECNNGTWMVYHIAVG